MSAQYASAADALERAESIVGPPSADTAALVGIGRALLVMGEELEALVELLRERLPVPQTGPAETVSIVYRPAGCTCVITEPGERPYPLPSEWREGCPTHPVAPDEPCTWPGCGVPRGEHGERTRMHDWIGTP